MKRLLIASALTALSAPSDAQEPLEYSLGSIEGLLGACTFTSDDQAEVEYHFGTCIGFIRGVRVAFETMSLAQGGAPFVCPPGGVTENGAMRDAVVVELRSAAHASDEVSTMAVTDALKRLYPCPAAQAGQSRS
jgi:hypothetical protein